MFRKRSSNVRFPFSRGKVGPSVGFLTPGFITKKLQHSHPSLLRTCLFQWQSNHKCPYQHLPTPSTRLHVWLVPMQLVCNLTPPIHFKSAGLARWTGQQTTFQSGPQLKIGDCLLESRINVHPIPSRTHHFLVACINPGAVRICGGYLVAVECDKRLGGVLVFSLRRDGGSNGIW